MAYKGVIQVAIGILIGWERKQQKETDGIFGEPVVYGDRCEKQARFTLHSYLSLDLTLPHCRGYIIP